MFVDLLLVALGGFLGAIVRYCVTSKLKKSRPSTFPVSTLLVNVIACFLLGVITSQFLLSSTLKVLVITGFLGSLSTFSTFIQDARELSKKEKFAAILFISLSIGLGLLSFEISFWFIH